MSELKMSTKASVATPASGKTTVYVDSTTKTLKSKNDAGAITDYAALGNAITSLTGEVTGTGPGAAATVVSNSAVLSKVLTGLAPAAGTVTAADTILQALNKLANRLNQSWFPTASDGDVVISGNNTLTRDMYYNTLVVNPGVILTTAGYRIFALVSIVCNGTIDRSGNDASGITAGAGLTAGTLGLGGAGGAGGAAAGAAGAATTGLGGGGGAGGLGSGGAGGAGGIATALAANSGGVEVFQSASRATLGRDILGTIIPGGSGGGGGGGDGVAGGGGGGGAGVMLLCSRSITGTGAIRAHGGNGGSPAGGNRGGGGGGGGGVLALVSENDTAATSLTFDVSGGSGNSGAGTGATGVNGTVGRIYRVRV